MLGFDNRLVLPTVPAMSLDLSSLNGPQAEAVRTLEGPVLILAGAGTGKTRVITYRMVNLIVHGVAPTQILAMTFTNKAAREMKERFAALAGEAIGPRAREAAKGLTAGTFHAFCARVLRQEIEPLGYGKNFTIYDEGDQTGLIKKIVTKFAGKTEKLDPAAVKSLISLAKNKGRPITDLTRDDLIHAVAQQYDRELKLLNALDFDDLLVLTVRLLRDVPEVRDRLRSRFHYLLVDEYQDTNALQLNIVRQLASDRHDVCVVGDDDQSIYSWRGAEAGNILEFERYFPNPKIIRLEQNYRSTPTILQAANHVIAQNVRRRAKKLWSAAPSGEPIRLVAAPSDAAEAEWVVNDLVTKHNAARLPLEAFAILYRVNQLSRWFEQELRRFRIPYRIVGGQGFYDRREVKDTLAYLHVALNPHDDAHLLRILNTPPRGIGETCVEILQENSRMNGRSIWEEIRSPSTPMSRKQTEALSAFAGLINRYHQRLQDSKEWSVILDNLLQEIGYQADLQRTCKESSEAQSRMENVRAIISDLANYAARPDATLQGFLDSVSLDREREEEDKGEAKGTGVTLMTLHGAKGLEFPHVYLVGLEDGYLPHERSKQEGNLDEERRLLYVGMTRAMQSLTLTHCVTRRKYNRDEPRTLSSFLQDMPEKGILKLHTGSAAVPSSGNVPPSRDPFAALRAKLGMS
ncbi:MAG: UvrD-helicase domain-containing protein [Candidatus Methylacidiphilales bacterium]